MYSYYPSRLQKKESRRNLRQALLFVFLSITLIILLIFLGIPALIKLAIFIGNVKNRTTPIETLTPLPPPPPRFKNYPEATNSAQLTLSGYTEPGNKVQLFTNDFFATETVADKQGIFAFTEVFLTTGLNVFYLKTVDQDQQTSQASSPLKINLDQQPPELIIDEPKDKQTFPSSQKIVNITGHTETTATLMLNEHLVVLDNQGKFTYPVELGTGENLFTIVASDQAGNRQELTLALFGQ